MGKKEIYERELAPLIEGYVEKGDETRLLEYLTGGSNLPGPRANLELLGAFGDLFSKRCREKPASYWELAMKLAGLASRFPSLSMPWERPRRRLGGPCSAKHFQSRSRALWGERRTFPLSPLVSEARGRRN